jgi:tRNA A-37 threonylcarbamoyl transferase component Bud32
VGTRVLLDRALAPAVSAAGLAAPDALFRLGRPDLPESVVAVVDLPVEGTVGRFHLKRYVYPDWRTSLRLLGRGTLWGRAPETNEFRMLALLREKGIPAARPVVAAARTSRGRLVGHALLTEHVPGTRDLAACLAAPGEPPISDVAVRRRLLGRIAHHVHRMHAEGLGHADLHARNVLVRVDEDDPRVWFVDCRRGGPLGWRRRPHADLATLDADLEGRVPATDRLRALRVWAGEGERLAPHVRRVLARRG